MAYGRDDDRRGWRETGRNDDFRGRDERGFFDRARDEVSSWFGDDRAEARRDRDERLDDRWDSERRERGWMEGRDYGRFERSPRWRDEGYRRPYTGRSGRQPFDGGDEDRYRPFAGDYGRGGREFTGTASGLYDNDYSSWRRRQIDEFDRDYDDFRRENSSRFENEFASWRGTRQAKRQLLTQVKEHMSVLGSDSEPVGTVDKVRGDRIILTKNDSPDGRHHAVSCSLVDRVEGDQVFLDRSAEEAKKQFTDEDRNRALFERDDDREEGAHMLNRSFSGTY